MDGIKEDWGLVQMTKSLFSSSPNSSQHESHAYKEVHGITSGAGSPDFLGNNLSRKIFSGSGHEDEAVGREDQKHGDGRKAKAAAAGMAVRSRTFHVVSDE